MINIIGERGIAVLGNTIIVKLFELNIWGTIITIIIIDKLTFPIYGFPNSGIIWVL